MFQLNYFVSPRPPLTADPMLAGAVHAAPASIPKALVLSGPPSVPVEGGPEKLLTECHSLHGVHSICGRNGVLVIRHSRCPDHHSGHCHRHSHPYPLPDTRSAPLSDTHTAHPRSHASQPDTSPCRHL